MSEATSGDEQMSLIEHLTELRYRLIRAGQGIAVGVGICVYYSENILTVIRQPILKYLGPNGGLVFTGVMDKFMAHLKVGVLGGFIITCPYWLFHLWKFISPGLYKNERRYISGFIISGTLLFACGVSFVYFLVYPAAFEYLLTIGGTVDKPMITIQEYLSFFMITTLMFGLSFELPVVLMVLAMIGLVDSHFLKSKRRYAFLILAVLAAVITPPDGLSMVMMLVPLYALYEISIWLIHFLITKPKEAAQAAELANSQ
jgi:sec-independent protein translocase protein TatC